VSQPAALRLLITADPMLPVPPSLYGGIERVIASLVTALRGRGHMVGLVAHPASTASVDARYAWTNAASGAPREHVANLRTLARAVRDFKPNVLHSFSRLAYLGALLASSRPKLMSYQRLPTPRTVRWAARLAGTSLLFTGCSEFIARLGRSAGGCWMAIPNCVDASRYRFVEHVPGEAPLVFLSRVERIKGAHHAIAIARRAGRRLVIAGNRAAEGPEAEYFEREIAPHVDGTAVRYLGPVDDRQKSELLGSCAGMLLPLEWDEPFGIVMIEAMACGTPVVAFRRGAVPAVFRHGVVGFIVEDVTGAAVAVRELRAIDRRRCRERVEQAFDVQPVAASYERAYRVMVTRP
jgi:glycosyltransferase involved in cell wall biosynthesis